MRALGEGLPLAITEQGYRDLLAATRVVRKGALAGAFGPVALSGAVSTMDQELAISAQIAPIPNLEVFAEQMGSAVRLRVTSVKDTQGKELLDPTNALVSDAVFEVLKLEREPSLFAPDVGAQQTSIEAVLVPGSDGVSLYATRSIPLMHSIDSAKLGRVEGRIEIALPVGAKVFEQRGSKWSLIHDPVSIDGTLDGKARSLRLVVTKGVDHVVTYVAKDAAGKVLESSSVSQGVREDGKATMESSYDDKVASVSIVLAASVLRQTYPFVLAR